MTVRMVGRGSPVARSSIPTLSEKSVETPKGQLDWSRWDIELFELSHVSALLVLQGLPLKKLFERVSFFSLNDIFEGAEFIFLRGTLSSPTSPPMRLQDVVLASIQRRPLELSQDELLSLLLQDVLGK